MHFPRPRCKHLVVNECSKLKTKCLEKRFFGRVEKGTCQIRKHKKLRPPPRSE